MTRVQPSLDAVRLSRARLAARRFLRGALLVVGSAAGVAMAQAPAPSLSNYATGLVKKQPALLTSAGPATATTNGSYMTVFKATAMTIRKDTNEGRLAFTEQWQKAYCTDELKAVMAREDLIVAAAKLVDSKDKPISYAVCVAEQPKNAPTDKDKGVTQAGVFSAIQVCRAALSTLFQRDIGSMKGAMVDGFAQVTYTRPTGVKRDMSYRCKLADGVVFTWDNTISGARWYGTAEDGRRMRYSVSGSQLLVADVIGTSVNRQARFTLAELAN